MSDKEDKELITAVKELKAEVKELRGMVNMLLNMMVEMDNEQEEDFNGLLLDRKGNDNFLMYN